MTVKELFNKIQQARLPALRPRPGPGEYLMIVEDVRVETSVAGHQVLLTDVLVAEHRPQVGLVDVSSAGSQMRWVWNVNAAGWAGAYEQSRANEFLTVLADTLGLRIMQFIGDDGGIMQFIGDDGGIMPLMRGALVRLYVSATVTRHGEPRVDRNNKAVLEAKWLRVHAQPSEVIERAAQACEAAALQLAESSPNEASAYMGAFQWLLHAPVTGNPAP